MQNYQLEHRPGDPITYPDEVATIDKLTSGKYFPKDILIHPQMYFPDFNNFPTEDLIRTLISLQNNPEKELTIYRGAPSNGKLNTGDWVTLSKEYAKIYVGNGIYSDNEDSKVYKYTVKAKELSFDGDSIYEFGYWGEPQIGEEIEYRNEDHLER